MKAKIDLEKFICSLMKRFYKIHNIDPLTTKCWLDKVLEDQGLEYRDGEIVEIPQESEDERIRKSIIAIINNYVDNSNTFKSKMIAWLEKQGNVNALIQEAAEKSYTEGMRVERKHWLEKQGEQKISVADFKAKDWYVSKVDGKIHNIYHSVDKVEPKVGDWITDGDRNLFQIAKIDNEWYYADDGDRVCFDVAHDYYHLWTIQDAKDGDTLCYKDEISLYKHDIKNCTKQETTFGGFVYHCCYDGKRFITDSLYSLTEQDKTDIHPATKEQRDLLFAKMKEAGYEWNAEKKELKKIEQKLANFTKTYKDDTILNLYKDALLHYRGLY